MTIIKSFSVGNGDMFAIRHHSDNFTIIDCCMCDENREQIFNDIQIMSYNKTIHRFISTHPDKDHIMGLESLDKKFKILNFYCVKNEAEKEDSDKDFKYYCTLRDSEKAFYIKKDCTRRWMNLDSNERKSANINILWPDINDEHFIDELEKTKNKESPNNISPIILLKAHGFNFMWMGDLTTDFMEKINIYLPKVDVLFAPHHGRKSGRIPEKLLEMLYPALIIIGEGSSNHLFYDYSKNFNTITQNTAGDITFEVDNDECRIYVSKENYSTKILNGDTLKADEKLTYIGDTFLDGYFLGKISRKKQ
ncbi:TPA: hypothetical protein RTF94_000945 [Campylobacter jejuni]|nr:hypothetical protein [Campylobacter jejuni]HDZ4933554.1 hypothetical protein [Campylobacter jejuni]HDZ4935139.1 hypothetical protein [Campylobacter jejuni]HDZ4939017.1 hypothetical protein [Campylobacter jejuni]HDZ4942701.1 hypothetical protein [Campylobacter jejuni]